MANKIELVKSELAFHGIRVTDNGECFSFMEGQDEPVKSNCADKIKHLRYEIEQDKEGLKTFWNKLVGILSNTPSGSAGGSVSTEKMYAASLKHMYRFANKYRHFQKDAKVIRAHLRLDVKRNNETTMGKVVDYKICVEWLDHIVRQNAYCCKLLSFFEKNRILIKQVNAQQMVPQGTFDMEGDESDPLKERRWEWDDDDFKDDTRPQNMEAVVGNDPEWLNEGFNWVDYSQEPYLYGDDENDPYGNTHYYNFKSKVHRGMDS